MNMVIIRFIIYVLAINGVTVNGENVGTSVPNVTIRTANALTLKPVINNSSLIGGVAAVSKNQTNFIVSNGTVSSALNNVATTAVMVATTATEAATSTSSTTVAPSTAMMMATKKKKNPENNYNKELNARSMLTTNNNGIAANSRKLDNFVEVSTKRMGIQVISESDSANNGQTWSNSALDDNDAVTVSMSTEMPALESGNDDMERNKQLKTLAPINQEKILLTANSSAEQFNNDIGGSWMLRNNDGAGGGGGGGGADGGGADVPRSVSNSIIATSTSPYTNASVATTTATQSNEELSIGNLVKMAETANKAIESFTSDANENSSSLLSTGSAVQSKTIRDPLFHANKANNLINSTHTNNDHRMKMNKVTTTMQHLVNTTTSPADGTIDSLNSHDETRGVHIAAISRWNKSVPFPIKHNSIVANSNRQQIPINLNHTDAMHTSTIPSIVQHVTSQPPSLSAVEVKRSHDDANEKIHTIENEHKNVEATASRLIKIDNESETGTPVDSVTERKTSDNDINTNKGALGSGSATRAMTTNAVTEAATTATHAVSQSPTTQSSILHGNTTSIQVNIDSNTVVAHKKPTSQHEVERNMHTESSSNHTKTTIAQLWFINSDVTTIRPYENTATSIASTMGTSKNDDTTDISGNSNISIYTNADGNSGKNLSQPSEIINLSTSSKLTMSLVLVDGENNSSSVNTLVAHPNANAFENPLSNIQRSHIRTQSTRSNNSSTIPSFEYHERNIDDNTNHEDFNDFNNSSSRSIITPSIKQPAAGDDLKSLMNGTNDKVMLATRRFALHDHQLFASHRDGFGEANYVNNLLTAAIAAEHEVGNQFAIDYSNGSSSGNDRCAFSSLFVFIHLFTTQV